VETYCSAGQATDDNIMRHMRFALRISFKGRCIGPVYGTAASIAFCTLGPKEFPHSSPEVPRTTQARETSTSEGGN
jgi:hypothetical protein